MNNRRITLVRPSQIFDTFMDEFFNSGTNLSQNFVKGIDIDMFETDTHVVIKFMAPGFQRDDIKITLEDNLLSVEGNIKVEEENHNKKYHLKEIREESFIRSVSLPTKVDSEKAEAKFEGGVMTITLPKAEEVKPKSIDIKPN